MRQAPLLNDHCISSSQKGSSLENVGSICFKLERLLPRKHYIKFFLSEKERVLLAMVVS